MKKLICATLAAMLLGTLMTGCGSDNPPEEFKAPPEIGFMAAGQFDGYKLGTVSSLVSEDTIKASLPGSYVYTYENAAEGLSALSEKKIHGMVLPELYADEELKKTPGMSKIEQTFIESKISGIFLNDSDYVLPIDAAITSIKNNGTAKKIARIHSPYATEEDTYTRPTDYEKAPGRVLKVGICSDENYPFNYRKDGNLVGVNVDVAYELAAGANAELEIKEYPKDDLQDALKNREVDIILSDYVYSYDVYEEDDEFYKSFLFSDTYYDASTVIVAINEFIGYSKDVLPGLTAVQ